LCDRGHSFISQEHLEQIITKYLRNYSRSFSPSHLSQKSSQNPHKNLSHADEIAVLPAIAESIKAPSGLLVPKAKRIFAFPYLAVQEYLTAYRIAHSSNPKAIEYLLTQIGKPNWINVFTLVATMLADPQELVLAMKQRIDKMLIGDRKIQEFLQWTAHSAAELAKLKSPYREVTLRALYLDLDLENARKLDRARAHNIAHMRALERARLRAEGQEPDHTDTQLDIDHALTEALNLDLAMFFARIPTLTLASLLEPNLDQSLKQLKGQIPDLVNKPKMFKRWWQTKGMDWARKFRAVIIQHRKNSPDWDFSATQEQQIRQYYDANKTLLNCLNVGDLDQTWCNELENSLLLPSDS
jgi:hypothetical protein